MADEVKVCQACGAAFRRKEKEIGYAQWAKAKACSAACRARLQRVPLAKRFWAKVLKVPGENACWVWIGNKNEHGYGTLGVNRKMEKAHRVALALESGEPIPDGVDVCHKCDNPSCVRPDHLFLGTMSDNIRDCVLKGRHAQKIKTHCPRGHPYSGENLLVRDGRRFCKECAREHSRRAKLRACGVAMAVRPYKKKARK